MTQDFATPAAENLIHSREDRAAWLALRHTGIGASEAGGLMGMSSYCDGFTIAAKKLDKPEEDPEPADWLVWGHLLEPIVLAQGCKVLGLDGYQDGWLRRSRENPFQLATQDGISWDATLPFPTEIKTYKFETDDHPILGRTDWGKEPPADVLAQVNWQLSTLDLKDGLVFGFEMMGRKLVTYEVTRNDGFCEDMLERGAKLWDCIMRRELPEPDGWRKDTAETLKRHFPPAKIAATVKLQGYLAVDLDAWLEAKEAKSAAEKTRKDHEAKLRAAIGSDHFGQLPDGRLLDLKPASNGTRTLRLKKSAK